MKFGRRVSPLIKGATPILIGAGVVTSLLPKTAVLPLLGEIETAQNMPTEIPKNDTTIPPENPPAITVPGQAVERPAGTVAVEWQNFDVEQALNTAGFAAFLQNYEDAEDFDMSDANKKEIAERFRHFELSRSVAKRFETVMNAKLVADKKDRITPEQRQMYKDWVAKTAAENPEELLDLERDLNALEEAPANIQEREAELARLKESWNAEKIKTGIAELATKKATIEQSLTEIDSKRFTRGQTIFFNNFGARLGAGKISENMERRKELHDELEEVGATIQVAEEALASTPEMLADTEAKVREAKSRLSIAQERIFLENVVSKKIREDLIDKTIEGFGKALHSEDIGTLQKAAARFLEEKKLIDEGTDYLDVASNPEYVAEYENELTFKLEEAIALGITESIKQIPAGATQRRLESALRKFIELADKGFGFKDKAESKEFVLLKLREAEKQSFKDDRKSGKSILLKRLVACMESATPIIV